MDTKRSLIDVVIGFVVLVDHDLCQETEKVSGLSGQIKIALTKRVVNRTLVQ